MLLSLLLKVEYFLLSTLLRHYHFACFYEATLRQMYTLHYLGHLIFCISLDSFGALKLGQLKEVL